MEREARSHLRPLKRQAEAAELHQRIERASRSRHGSGWRGTTSAPRACRAERGRGRSTAARSERDEAERLLAEVARRREAARGVAAQSRLREQLQGRLFAARSAAERIGIRLERSARPGAVRRRAPRAPQRAARAPGGAAALRRQSADPTDRISELEAELAGLEQQRRERRLSEQLADLETLRQQAEQRRDELALPPRRGAGRS